MRRRVGPWGHPLGFAATPPSGAQWQNRGAAGAGGGQLAVEVLDELRVGPGELGSAGPQLEGHPQDLGVVGEGAEMLGRPIGQDGLYEGLDAVIGHWSSSSATRAAIRRARCWRTLALLTLTARGGGRLLDGAALQEPQLQDAPIMVGQSSEDLAGQWAGVAVGGGSGHIAEVSVGLDAGHFQAEPAAPVRGQHGSGGGQQVGADFAFGRGQPQRPQGRPEHLRGEIFGVGTVPHLGVHEPVQTAHIVEIGRVPVRIGAVIEGHQRDHTATLVLTARVPRGDIIPTPHPPRGVHRIRLVIPAAVPTRDPTEPVGPNAPWPEGRRRG